MNILLHTIALEPARWTPQRVSQPLAALIPKIAATPFKQLEIYEPHLTMAEDEAALPELLAQHGLAPVVLSSYLNITPHVTTADAFTAQLRQMKERVRRFGFKKIRLFPAPGIAPTDRAEEQVAAQRVRAMLKEIPGVEILLETHDGSMADVPQRLVDFVNDIAHERLGLLFQPTAFQAEPALEQFKLQQPLIRHIHLQNRKPDASQFAKLLEGVIPWPKILVQLGFKVDGSIEFVPSGICTVQEFDLDKSLSEAVSEAASVRKLNPLEA